jgi:ribonuclease P protein component
MLPRLAVASDQSFPPERRLRRRSEFLEVYEKGRRFSGRLVVVFATLVEGDGSRLGITVTKKVGTAAVRNRLKRRVREIFRRSEAARAVPCRRLVVNVSSRAAEASFSELRAEIESLLARALRGPG